MPENDTVFSCVPICLRSVGPFDNYRTLCDRPSSFVLFDAESDCFSAESKCLAMTRASALSIDPSEAEEKVSKGTVL